VSDKLARAIERVVSSDNCSGCGGCTLISERVSMVLKDGYMRPEVEPGHHSRAQVREFRTICPGSRLEAPVPKERSEHPTFGPYVEAFQGYAVDPAIRRAGSSAGILTALAAFMTNVGIVREVAAVGPGNDPLRSVPVRIVDRDTALRAAGSRYAPVSVLSPSALADESVGLVGKPCEVAAAAQLDRARGLDSPIRLSFFCAGVPTQKATVDLVRAIGVDPERTEDLRYRGDGWPGQFVASDRLGNRGAVSYEESWGGHLGKTVQWRCKLCPDGTGAHSDVSVGDFWEADDKGFPVFADGQGNSVVIARTSRGLALLRQASAAGVIHLEPVDLDQVAGVQPLQVRRKQQLAGRLFGRRLAGRRIPRYYGYGLLRHAAPYLRQNIQAAVGTARRSAPLALRELARRLRGPRGKN
jgi:coenzyme F420 hydrogenase subunit beta